MRGACIHVCVYGESIRPHKMGGRGGVRKRMYVSTCMFVHLLVCEEMKDPIEENRKCCQW